MVPRLKSFYSGAGLMDLGLRRSKVELVASYEIDSTCVATARRNFSHRIIKCDLTQRQVLVDEDCDAMVCTYPCDSYSEISAMHGCRTGDEHYLHFLRQVAIRQPYAYVLENVPGMKKFPVVMEAMTKLPGYWVRVFCPVETQGWLPQRRNRLIIFGTRKPFSFRPPNPRRRVTLKQIIEKDPHFRMPKYVLKRIRGGYRDLPIISDPAKDDLAPTCVAHYSRDLSTRLVVDKKCRHKLRPYTVREYARLQGVPDDFVFLGNESKQYQMIGNGVSVPVGEWIGRELMRYFNS